MNMLALLLNLQQPIVNTPVYLRLFAWLGIAACAVQLNAIPLDYLLFRLNQEHIARTQCEHKTPHCNGHCFLMKQIANAGKSNDGTSTNDIKTEQSFGQLDGQFLVTSLNSFTLFSSPVNFFTHIVQPLAPGWHSTPHQPPRFA